jgi:hypothetical protein
MKIIVFSDVTPYSLVSSKRRVRRTFCCLICTLENSYTLKIKAASSSTMSIMIHKITQRHISEDSKFMNTSDKTSSLIFVEYRFIFQPLSCKVGL